MKEANDKQERQLNLIVVNVKESSTSILADAKEEDKRRVQSMLKDILPEDENVEISNPVSQTSVKDLGLLSLTSSQK